MTFRPWTQWPAEEPPPEFADRMVGRLLDATQPVPRPAPSQRRWVVALALAAALAGTTAWAMMHYAGSRSEQPPAAPAEQPALVVEPVPAASPARGEPVPVSSAPALDPVAPAVPAASVRPKTQPAGSAPVPPASASAKRVVVPRCECGPGSFICTCVE